MVLRLGSHQVQIDLGLRSEIEQYAWKVVVNHGRPEVIAWIDGQPERLHRFVWKLRHGSIPPGMVIDHINRDSLDNRSSNLRLATPAQNLANQTHRSHTSRFRGVRRKGPRWTAQIQVDGRQINLGSYRTEQAAARAYDVAARRYYGEYANTNLGG